MPKKKPPPAPWSVISDAYWSRASSVPEPWSREPRPVRMAVVMGLFHTQMRRNGGQFWITNGYHVACAQELRARLADLGTDTAREVAAMLVELDAIGLEVERLEESEDDESEAAFEDLATRCQTLTERYWQLGPALMAEVDAWLVGTRESR
ncbi:MAG: hypothetical protein H6719_38020 [Sandaracinaceae bacterium]|nr:hypothetical protein [Sandaracinaceae bacterium]